MFKAVGTPIHHLQCWHKKHEGTGRHMVEFVCARAKATCAELDAIIENEYTLIDFVMSIDSLPADDQDVWVADAVGSVVEASTDYSRRVLKNVTEFPRLLLWLVYTPANTYCAGRVSCAQDLVSGEFKKNTDPRDATDVATTAKVAAIFAEELLEAAASGTLADYVYDFMLELAKHWLPNTRRIEGINSVIKRIVIRAPFIAWRLLCSRP